MHDFDCFLKGLQPSTMKNVNDCKDIFEGYEEAIGVEYLLTLYHMRKAKSQKLTAAQVVEPMTKDIKPDINKQDQEKREVTANSDETRCETLDMNEISALFKEYSEFLSSNKFDQQV
eukprot:TRINITY_DN5995_c1_g1_i1.p1 TRINITY_DN5995_c1_g1~~TRINITY_DN5995_c1_g1_i1.p1  ORF type:complete len:117 (-),score=27.25 TRINITY_DN5995_c1_g1_i1:1308-1658(-)